MCAQRISGMEAFIPHTFSNPHTKKPWFNHACSLAIKDRETVHKRYQTLRTPANHDLYISARNHSESVLRLSKNSYINRQ